MKKKSVISLISYDSHYLPESIKRYYNYVDEIVLGLDKDRISWSNKPFSFDESKLWQELSAIDGDNKISIIEENFHQATVAMENDTAERNVLKAHCTHDWIFSIDSDEYLVNAKDFFYDFCPIVERYYEKADICMNWATPYKQIGDTILVIANEDDSPFFGEDQGVVTHKNNTFTWARWTNVSAAGKNRIKSPLIALHWSLCRSKDSLQQKVVNSSHSDLAGKDPFFSIWDQVTLDNYQELKNFKTSGLGGAQWPKLFALPVNELESYIKHNAGRAY